MCVAVRPKDFVIEEMVDQLKCNGLREKVKINNNNYNIHLKQC